MVGNVKIYLQFIDKDADIDFAKEMEKIRKSYTSLIKQDLSIQKDLKEAFKGLGYEIEL